MEHGASSMEHGASSIEQARRSLLPLPPILNHIRIRPPVRSPIPWHAVASTKAARLTILDPCRVR
jgi:hypothetical protein